MSNQTTSMFHIFGFLFLIGGLVITTLTYIYTFELIESLMGGTPLFVVSVIFYGYGTAYDNYYHSDDFVNKRVENVKNFED